MEQKASFISNFKRPYTKTFLFLGTLVLLALAFQHFFERKIILNSLSSSSYKINRIITSQDQYEIPIFGASRAQGAFIPDSLGPAFFNYGIDGIRDNVILFFLEQECKKQKKTPYTLLTFELEGYTNAIGDPDSYILNCNNPEVKQLLGSEFKPYYNVPFVKYFGKYESYFKDYLNDRMMLTKYKDKGASIEKNVLTPEKFASLVEARKSTATQFRNDNVLETEFIQLFKNNPDRRFIIIIPPYHPSYFEQYVNYNDAVRFLAYLSTFKNIVVLNYSHLFYPDSCYMNTTHLNYKGALLFNKVVKDTLQKIMSN